MIHSARFTAILDANVLYPAPLRDYLLNLADLELYKPKWTAEIQEEWIRNLLINRPDLKRKTLKKACNAMDEAFPDANISNYEELIVSLSLPDEKDRHVLAAAIRGNADVIVTFNLKDFPATYLRKYDIEVQHPDKFITNLISLDKAKSLEAINIQVENLKNPPRSKEEVMQTLQKCGLQKSISLLKIKE
jgi:predicted nucleic acid-binding protein